MSKYKVGDKVLIEGEVTRIEDPKNTMYGVSFQNGGYNMFREKWLSNSSKTYEDGLNDAWELAKKLYDLDCNTLEEIYGVDGGFYELMKKYTAQEALAKIEAYEKSQQIQVGDVVECFSDYKGVVLDCDADFDTLDVFTENGEVNGLAFSDVKKTGRHIDISSILEQIRGNE